MRTHTSIILENHEKKLIQEALLPWRILETAKNLDRDLLSMAVKAERIAHGGGNRPYTPEQIELTTTVLEVLAEHLEAQSMAKADPVWVQQAKEAEAQGVVPLVVDPEGAVAMIAEIRARQVLAARRALTILTEAKHRLQMFDTISANMWPEAVEEDDIMAGCAG